MEIRKINDSTIRCIITQEDLNENDIDLDDFLEHKPKAMNYLRNIMAEAAQKENFQLEGPFTTMQIRVLKDQSICLTFTQGIQTDLLHALQEIARKLSEEDSPEQTGAEEESSEALSDSDRMQDISAMGTEASSFGEGATHYPCGRCRKADSSSDAGLPAIYAVAFPSMDTVVKACGQVPETSRQESSLYYDVQERIYYLLVRPDKEEAGFGRALLAMNEFGEFLELTPGEAAYIMEHGLCILKENAAQSLRSV